MSKIIEEEIGRMREELQTRKTATADLARKASELGRQSETMWTTVRKNRSEESQLGFKINKLEEALRIR